MTAIVISSILSNKFLSDISDIGSEWPGEDSTTGEV